MSIVLLLAAALSVVSPDGRNEIRLHENPLGYEVLRGGKTLVARSEFGLTVDGAPLASGKRKVVRRELSGVLPTPIYKKAQIDLAAREAFADYGDWGVRLVARNDGVAYRFELKRAGEVIVNDESAAFRFPAGTDLAYSVRHDSFTCSFESVADFGDPSSVPCGENDIVIAPFAATVPGAGVVGVTESNLLDYPGLNFRRREGEKFLCAAFAREPDPARVTFGDRKSQIGGRFDYLARTQGPRALPWRTFIVADNPSALVASDLVYALAEPCRLADTSWIRPGLVQWDWWHGFKITDVPGLKTGCNYATYKAYVDFAATNGIAYIIMDEGWSEHLDLNRPRKKVNVPGVVKYAREKGVGVILWAAWAQLANPEARAKIFDRYAAMGVKGFKIDFMDRDDRLCERFLEETAADAAARKLVVLYHGTHKPTGLSRAYPNILNYEGVYGLEQGHRGGGRTCLIPNDCAIPYMRMLAGPLDYTPGAMHNRAKDAPAFDGKREPCGCYGTRCHQLALFALFEAPVQMLCDSPTQYRKAAECTRFLTAVPTTWDDTVGLVGEIGRYSAIARRKGGDWWLGAITDWSARELTLPTDFLGGGEWCAEAFEDAPDAATHAENYVRRAFTLKGGEPLKVTLAPGGGCAIRFTKRK